MFGAVGQRVAVLAPCSVMIARGSLERHGFFICTDGTARSMQAVRRGGARPCGQGTDHAVLRRPDLAGAQAAEENVKNARALLKAMGIKVAGIETAIGEPAELIIERGSNHRIIVVSDEGRSRLQRVFRGSIAYEVVKAARTSVLDVR